MSKYYIYKMTAITEDGNKGCYIGQHKIGKKESKKLGYHFGSLFRFLLKIFLKNDILETRKTKKQNLGEFRIWQLFTKSTTLTMQIGMTTTVRDTNLQAMIQFGWKHH